ncbi:hypothetical protein CC2G_003760 [Coprinopsis cinerea AmutBmut pab1-1]|nr:hypothetical protein CC2G_003760 [Coprinopsis cinerea AmutBmut pab1-1]
MWQPRKQSWLHSFRHPSSEPARGSMQLMPSVVLKRQPKSTLVIPTKGLQWTLVNMLDFEILATIRPIEHDISGRVQRETARTLIFPSSRCNVQTLTPETLFKPSEARRRRHQPVHSRL